MLSNNYWSRISWRASSKDAEVVRLFESACKALVFFRTTFWEWAYEIWLVHQTISCWKVCTDQAKDLFSTLLWMCHKFSSWMYLSTHKAFCVLGRRFPLLWKKPSVLRKELPFLCKCMCSKRSKQLWDFLKVCIVHLTTRLFACCSKSDPFFWAIPRISV